MSELKPGDIVVVNQDYNREAFTGMLAIVEKVETHVESSTPIEYKHPLVTIYPIISHRPYGKEFRTQIYDFRLDKVGKVEHAD